MVTLLLGVWLALAPQNTTILQGTVQRGGGSDPIAGVEITLFAAGAPQGERRSVTSDAQGRFTFENIPFGKYQVQPSREGYFAYPTGQPLPTVVATLTIDSPQTRQIAIDLMPGATIAGRLTDSQGRPLADVGVSATTLQYDEGRPVFAVGTLPRLTNDRGEFRVFWLPPGEYYLLAETGSANLAEARINDILNVARRAYYPGTVDSAAAAPITIRGGESLEGMNFSLPTTANIRITGHVSTTGPLPSGGVVRSFYLLPRDGRPADVYPAEFINTIRPLRGLPTLDFALEVRGLPPGAYDLAPFYIDGNTFYTGRTPIDIGDRDLENVVAIVHSNVDIPGKVISKDNLEYAKWRAIHLELRARDAAVPLTSRAGSAVFQPDGTFTIRNAVEGRYFLYTRSIPEDLYISEIRQGGLDLRDEGIIDVRQGMSPLEITLSTGAGRIEGIVEDGIGGIPARADVVLVPQPSRRQNVMFYDRTTIDDKGQFNFTGIAPGEYKVFAFEQLADSAEKNPQFIGRYEALGQGVTVNAGATEAIRVRLLR